MSSAPLYASYGQWVHANYHEWTRSLFVKATRQECPGWTAFRCFLERDASGCSNIVLLLLLFRQLLDDRAVIDRRISSFWRKITSVCIYAAYRTVDRSETISIFRDFRDQADGTLCVYRDTISRFKCMSECTCTRKNSTDTYWRICEKEIEKCTDSFVWLSLMR